MGVITGNGIRTVNPATGELIAEYGFSAPDAVDAALDRAVAAQRALGASSFEARAALLRAVGAELTATREEFARLISIEMGKVLPEALAEIDKSVSVCEYYAAHGAEHLANLQIPTQWTDSYVQFPPLGVVLAIMPWNYPVWQVMRAAAPAWMAGNSIVLKHAPNVSGSALELAAIVSRAAGDESPLETLLLDGPETSELIGDRRISAVTLTGSEAVGVLVAEKCAAELKRSVLELGGSDPFIVLADADVEAAAQAAVKARFLNAGQSCIAGKRFIVVDAIADQFTEAFAVHTAQLRAGDPFDAGVQLGPMARHDLRDNLADQVRRGVAAGGRLVVGGEPPEGPGAFFTPTLVADVEPGSALAVEETFGPAAALLRARDTADAIRVANRSRYGLSSSLWTQDLDLARQLASRIEAGAVFVNTPSASDPRMPFGGVKRSGWGRELGPFGIREFVNVQSVTVGPEAAHGSTG